MADYVEPLTGEPRGSLHPSWTAAIVHSRATADKPMTGPQVSYLKTLLQQAGKSESDLDPNLTKAEASRLLDDLQQQTSRGAGGGNRSCS